MKVLNDQQTALNMELAEQREQLARVEGAVCSLQAKLAPVLAHWEEEHRTTGRHRADIGAGTCGVSEGESPQRDTWQVDQLELLRQRLEAMEQQQQQWREAAGYSARPDLPQTEQACPGLGICGARALCAWAAARTAAARETHGDVAIEPWHCPAASSGLRQTISGGHAACCPAQPVSLALHSAT
jgi:hypothetical protein